MEGKALEVAVSRVALISLEQIYKYGIETFSLAAANIFIDELTFHIEQLSFKSLLHPECWYLTTKSQMYRNIIHGSYQVIYRITELRIEVLNVIHSSRSISTIKAARKIKV